MPVRHHLQAAGSNSGGQLGLGHDTDSHTLQPCKTADGSTFPPDGYNIIDLSSGANHTVALIKSTLNDDVQIWASGSGREGQLGKPLHSSINAFQRLDLVSDLGLGSIDDTSVQDQWRPVLLRCGWDSTFLALRHLSDESQNDILLVLGKNNDFGQLGVGQVKVLQSGIARILLASDRDSKKEDRMRVCCIACGLRHTLVLCTHTKKEGDLIFRLYGWGAGRQGQLGKRAAVYWEPILIDEWESDGKGCIILEAGKEHTIYHNDGMMGARDRITYLGSNRQGEQNVCTQITGTIKEAGCTWNATLVLQEGQIVASGNNSKGQLGQPDVGSEGIAEISSRHLTCSGGSAPIFEQLACGSEHVLVLCEAQNGSYAQVWGWGWNEHGNLAQYDEQDRKEPVLVWPPKDTLALLNQRPTQIWAGCGTSFVLLSHDNP